MVIHYKKKKKFKFSHQFAVILLTVSVSMSVKGNKGMRKPFNNNNKTKIRRSTTLKLAKMKQNFAVRSRAGNLGH